MDKRQKRNGERGDKTASKKAKLAADNEDESETALAPKPSPDGSALESKVVLGGDLCNYRRFSGRERKQTEFYHPQRTPSHSKDEDNKSQRLQLNVRRVLHFNDTRHPILRAQPERTIGEDNAGVDILSWDNSATTAAAFGQVSVPVSPGRVPTLQGSLFPEGAFVWGKIPGYSWWPGVVMCLNKTAEGFSGGLESSKDSDNQEEEDEDGGTEVWVKWFGDNQLSKLLSHKLAPFDQFINYLNPSKFKGLYKKAVMSALKEAAKRCGKDVTVKTDDHNPSWIFHTSLVSEHDILPPSPPIEDGCSFSKTSAVLFTPVDSETCKGGQEEDSKTAKEKRSRGGRDRRIVQITAAEKELLEWAVEGFQPWGAEGIKPKLNQVERWSVLENESMKQTSDSETPPTQSSKKNEVTLVRHKINFELVRNGQVSIEDVCIGCGSMGVVAEQPLFHGGYCKDCKVAFMECAYLFDDDGTQMYCTICSAGQEVFMCDTPNCSKVYCAPCILKLCGIKELEKVKEADGWTCYMCSSESEENILLKRREDYHQKLQELFLNDHEMEYDPPRYYPHVSADERRPLRVLGLFDGIGTGLLVLKELGFEVERYVASEIDMDAVNVSRVQHTEIVHVGAIEHITEKEIQAWGPFDLVMGGSPCNDLSIVNPARKGIYEGTGRLFFEFFRVLRYSLPPPGDERPFFWLYENVVSMRAPDKQTISRFLQSNPVVVDAKDISAAHRARYFWGNLPGMNRPAVALPGDRLSLQECLEPNCFRKAQFTKLRTITTKMNSIKQTKKALMPVAVEGEEEGDVLWCTEMERLFGFPDHYTDAANLGRCGRQRLLGKAWSVPVMRHLLSPLKDYFKSNTTGTPSSVKLAAAVSSSPSAPTN